MEAKSQRANFAEWEVTLKGARGPTLKLAAHAVDEAGNVEKLVHERTVEPGR